MASAIDSLSVLIFVLLVFCLLGGAPVMAAMFLLWSDHRQKMAEIKFRKREVPDER